MKTEKEPLMLFFDCETIKSHFICCAEDIEGSRREFVVDKEGNGLKEFIKFLKLCKSFDYYFVGFNSINFDAQVIEKIWNSSGKFINAPMIHAIAQKIINCPDDKRNKVLTQEKDLSFKQIDLYRINHYDNKNKRTSLKWVEFALRMVDVREMPYHHNSTLNQEELKESIEYCWNDVDTTRKFYELCRGESENALYKGVDQIGFRFNYKELTKLPCINWNDVKIGDKTNLKQYCLKTGIKQSVVNKQLTTNRKRIWFKDCIPDFVSFQTIELVNFLNMLKTKSVTSTKEFNETLVFKNVIYTFAQGGLHSKDSPRILKSDDNYILRDADVGSMYPTEIAKRSLHPEHLQKDWCENIVSFIYKRFEYKPLIKNGDKNAKVWSDVLKLAMNGGGYGKTNELNSWQYDPLVTMSVTLSCQLQLLMLIEMLELSDIHIMSANTDGIVSLVPRNKEELYNSICKKWELRVGNVDYGNLEFTDYVFLAQTSVNDYIALKTNGEIKNKGDFEYNKEIHKNHSFMVIPKALEQHFVHKVDYVEFIKNHDNLFDFLGAVKQKSDFVLEFRDISFGREVVTKGQRVTRYYVSKTGQTLSKRYISGKKAGSTTMVEKGYTCKELNKITSLNIEDYDINYDYYISKVRDMINSIEPLIKDKQLCLF